MRGIYILLVLVVAAAALGCISQKQPKSTVTPASPAGTPVPSPVSPGETLVPSGSIPENDQSGLESDILQIDSMLNESSIDISFSQVDASTFT